MPEQHVAGGGEASDEPLAAVGAGPCDNGAGDRFASDFVYEVDGERLLVPVTGVELEVGEGSAVDVDAGGDLLKETLAIPDGGSDPLEAFGGGVTCGGGEQEYARRALNEGAAGFILKTAASTELEQAIQTVMRGEVYFRKTLIDDRKDTKKELLDSLSPRQREVLRLIAKGQTTKQIGRLLGISAKTVESHRSQLMDRLNIRDVAGLVRFAISVGLVDPNED